MEFYWGSLGKIGLRSTLRSWKIITRNGVIKHGSEIPELRALKWNNPAHWRILQQYLMTPGRNNHIPSGKRLHSCGKSPFSMGKSTISTGSFSIAMLVYQRVMNSVYKPLSSLFYLFLVENPYNMNNEKIALKKWLNSMVYCRYNYSLHGYSWGL